MRWRKSARDGHGDVFLDGTESGLTDFGETAGDGFAHAWNAHPPPIPDHSEPFLEVDEDERSRRARDLDRRSYRGLVALAVVVIVGVGLAVAVDRGLLSDPTGLTPESEGSTNEIASIGDDRTYVAGSGRAELGNGSRADQRFTAAADTPTPELMGSITADDALVFERLLWGGRAHVVVLGEDVSALDEDGSAPRCAIVSLVAADLRVVDLAAHGSCQPGYEATGDRVACSGDGIVMLEVWPFDPDAVVEQPDVTAIRVRSERVDEATGSIESIRGAMVLEAEFLELITIVEGVPGDEVTVNVGDRSGTCTLLDRAEVTIQLL